MPGLESELEPELGWWELELLFLEPELGSELREFQVLGSLGLEFQALELLFLEPGLGLELREFQVPDSLGLGLWVLG